MSRFPEPDKSAGIGGMRVQTYIRKRIKELSVGKGLLAYTWDGGSADYAECVVNSTERTIYDSHHHSFSSYRNPQMPNNSVDSSRFFPADGRYCCPPKSQRVSDDVQDIPGHVRGTTTSGGIEPQRLWSPVSCVGNSIAGGSVAARAVCSVSLYWFGPATLKNCRSRALSLAPQP